MTSIKGSTGVVIKGPKDLEFGTIPFDKLGSDEVIVKVHSAPINPSDQGLLAGSYPAGKTFPCTAGIEGAGLVVEAGSGPDAQALLGKRVSFFSRHPSFGTWSDFCLTTSQGCFPLPDEIDYEQAACALVNPLTVESMMLECEEKGYRAVVHAAASSQLGRMMVQIAPKHGIKVINIVRRAENVALLKSLGAEIVIDQAEDGWEAALAAAIKEVQPQAFFDPVCGELGSKIVAALPMGATVYGYGALGGFTYTISLGDLAFQNKTIVGFWLNHELVKPRIKKAAAAVMANLKAGVYKTVVTARYNTTEFAKAVEHAGHNATAGKVLLQNANF